VIRYAVVLALALASPTARADPKPGEDDHDRHARRRIAVIVGSVGAASVVVGIFHAIGSVEDRRDADALCHPDCTDQGTYLAKRAHGLARGAEILIGSGLAVVGAGVAIWWTAPGIRITPVVAPSMTGAVIEGRF
jgi:hypothetical protein